MILQLANQLFSIKTFLKIISNMSVTLHGEALVKQLQSK